MPNILLLAILTGGLCARFSVSGFSSGGSMSTQMHVAYSSYIEGSAILAGVPYFCAGNSQIISNSCNNFPWLIDMEAITENTKYQSSLRTIDDVSNLRGSPVWVFSGKYDTIVHPDTVKKVSRFYEEFESKVKSKFDIPSEHAWVTNYIGNNCTDLVFPYINNCGYDSAEMLLKHIYGDSLAISHAKTENFHAFNQTTYFEDNSYMYEIGYIYIPDACEINYHNCHLHIAFHGCTMSAQNLYSYFALNTGLNQWAEGSSIVVIYPQVKTHKIVNPYGCWDFWGYTGSNYAFKEAPQLKTVFKMTQDLPAFNQLLKL